MRKITEESVNAFYANKRFKKRNMEVYVGEFSTQLRLHGNTIAILNDNRVLEITTCGYNTNTTRDRLSALKGVIVRTKLGQLYLNGEKWDGKLTTIN
jgi:hypothetical protein